MVIKQTSQVIVMDGHLWQPQQLNFPTTTTILLCNTILLQYYSKQQLLLLLWYTDNFSVTFYMNAL